MNSAILSSPETWLYIVFGAIVIFAAFGVVFMANPVHSALSLVGCLAGVAGLFLVQEAYFLSVVQIIVYTGAIVVLFLFVIMLLGVDKADPREEKFLSSVQFRAGFIGAVLLLLVVLVGASWLIGWSTGAPTGTLDPAQGNVEQIARALFTAYLLPFELTSVLVVAAIVGAIVLAKRDKSLYGAGIGRTREVTDAINAEVEERIATAAQDDADDRAPVEVAATTVDAEAASVTSGSGTAVGTEGDPR